MICPICLAAFTARAHNRPKIYCSTSCRRIADNERGKARTAEKRLSTVMTIYTCPICKNTYKRQSHLKAKMYCSAKCSSKAAKARSRITIITTNCVVCNKQLPPAIRTTRIYCSQLCINKSPKTQARYLRKQGKRRAIKLKAFVSDVDRSAIYKRDDWRCQICKLKVNPRYTGTHPKAPSLDHIIPLAVGGTHQPSNVQLAHFGCNARKSSRAANDQLLLIG